LGNMGVISRKRVWSIFKRVQSVTQKGMTDCLAVNPYLMSPAGLQSEFYQGGAVKTLKEKCA